MASEENGCDRVFHKGNEIDHFYGPGWDPMVSLNSSMVPQNEFDSAHFMEHQILGSSSHLVHFPSEPSSVEMLPKIPSFGSGSFSEMVSSFGHIAKSGSHSSFGQNNMVGIQRAWNSKDHCQNSGDGVLRASPNRSRKRKVSVGASSKNVEEPLQDTSEFPKEDDEKKQKPEKNVVEQTVEQAKDNSSDAEPPKENYIHIRAKRGQATNSHSLAERVRRERISERMRLLQELVPGCDKITGKAVMLDEIINYVQSLQQQVEFLSMKLATVNPELNVDIERILSKDILHSLGSSSTALGDGMAMSSSHPFPGYLHGPLNAAPGTSSFHPLPHNIWNHNELQSILQMGFDSDHPVSSLGPNGMSKMEL